MRSWSYFIQWVIIHYFVIYCDTQIAPVLVGERPFKLASLSLSFFEHFLLTQDILGSTCFYLLLKPGISCFLKNPGSF